MLRQRVPAGCTAPGYIGGYASFIGFDKQNGNTIAVLQNAFNWSNYLGIAGDCATHGFSEERLTNGGNNMHRVRR
ncbi:hypothetical protein EXT70_09545 [Dickeya dadantii]|nr:hypothetical protein [Dickeya dadantii]